MSDLLTPSESQAFQTFLSSMDYNESNDVRNNINNNNNLDWAAYNNNGGPQGHSLPDVPHLQGREALAKATKDLMSLDADPWSSAPAMQQFQHQQQSYNFMNHQSSQYGYDLPQNHRQSGLYQQQQHQRSQRNGGFPFLSKQGSQSPHPPLNHSHSAPPHLMSHGHLPQPISIAPSHTMGASQDQRNLRGSFSSMGSPPTTGSSSSFSYASSSARRNSSNSTIPSPTPSADSLQRSGSPGASSNKRAADSMSYLPSNKRSRPSPPAAPLPNKSTLLSPSQKKANHIQSEQKRRANIRRGYEALCETVPALREAIRLEDEAQLASDAANGNGKKTKRGRRAKIDDSTGEKIDGRAGPRSENIVLGKTIEYIKDLLTDRQDLLARLERARSSLAPNHPSGIPSDPQPLWEREWKGGSGKDGDAEEDEEDEEED